MSEHYFSENPTSKHNYNLINYSINNETLIFKTDAGVFSKKEIDAGSDLLIKSIPQCSSGQILDIGCGYGPIGISLASVNKDAKILMADINSRAVELCKQNILQNKIKNADVVQSDSFTNIQGIFQYIVTNPPIRAGKKVIYAIFEDSINHLALGGHFYIVIQKKQGAESALKKLMEVYGNCFVVNKKIGYIVYRCIKDKTYAY